MGFFKKRRHEAQPVQSSRTDVPAGCAAEKKEASEMAENAAAKPSESIEDRREEQEYFDAGIQIHRKDGKAEEFYYQGQRVSREQADKIADYLIKNGRCPSVDEI